MTALERNHDAAAYVLAANDRLASAAQEIAQLRASLAEARDTIRRLEMRLALATSRVTPWQSLGLNWREEDTLTAIRFEEVFGPGTIRLGDGTPEQGQT